MTIIITDEDVKRLLPMRDCIEAMRVAFRDFADGSAVNRPRMRYLARHPDPERKYLANVHVGAVPSCGHRLRAGRLADHQAAERRQRSAALRESAGLQLGHRHSLQHRDRRAAGADARIRAVRACASAPPRRWRSIMIARPDAATLGLFGTGKQARCALEAIALVRPMRRVNVYSPNAEHRAAFVREMSARRDRRGRRSTDPRDGGRRRRYRVLRHHRDEAGVRRRLARGRPARRLDRQFGRDQQALRGRPARPMSAPAPSSSTIGKASSTTIRPSCSIRCKEGVIRREQVHELGDLVTGKVRVGSAAAPAMPTAGDRLLQEQFRPGDPVCRRGRHPLSQGDGRRHNKTIPTEWLGSDLSAYYKAGFRPSP